LPEDIARYRDKYLDGWDVMRERWFARQREMNVVGTTLSELEPDVGPPYHFPEALKRLGPGEINRPLPWTKLTDEQRRFQATKMAIHAAMIARMDADVGRLVALLRELKIDRRTLVLFREVGVAVYVRVVDSRQTPAGRFRLPEEASHRNVIHPVGRPGRSWVGLRILGVEPVLHVFAPAGLDRPVVPLDHQTTALRRVFTACVLFDGRPDRPVQVRHFSFPLPTATVACSCTFHRCRRTR
jgi:hypothetical protein